MMDRSRDPEESMFEDHAKVPTHSDGQSSLNQLTLVRVPDLDIAGVCTDG